MGLSHSFLAERVGFEPTWRINAKLISSQPRYDLFDTAPESLLLYPRNQFFTSLFFYF